MKTPCKKKIVAGTGAAASPDRLALFLRKEGVEHEKCQAQSFDPAV
jgi:hypothetical protein